MHPALQIQILRQRPRPFSRLLLPVILPAIVCYVLTGCVFPGKRSALDICPNGFESDRQLTAVIDDCLSAAPEAAAAPEQFAALKDFLLKQPCVQEVQIFAGEIRTAPPLKKIRIAFRNEAGNTVHKTVLVSMKKQGFEVNRIQND